MAYSSAFTRLLCWPILSSLKYLYNVYPVTNIITRRIILTQNSPLLLFISATTNTDASFYYYNFNVEMMILNRFMALSRISLSLFFSSFNSSHNLPYLIVLLLVFLPTGSGQVLSLVQATHTHKLTSTRPLVLIIIII